MLKKEVTDLEKQITDLEKLVNKHPVDASEYYGHIFSICLLYYLLSISFWTHHYCQLILSNTACADDDARIMELAQDLPNGCMLTSTPTLGNDYRLVCTEPGSIQIHLPDMWYVNYSKSFSLPARSFCSPALVYISLTFFSNATAVLVGGGGSGGNSPGSSVVLFVCIDGRKYFL